MKLGQCIKLILTIAPYDETHFFKHIHIDNRFYLL